MSSLQQLETSLDGILNKNAPVTIPPEGRKGLAGALWWIAIIVGILELWAAITLWQWGHVATRFADTVNYYSGNLYVAPHLGLFYYLSLLAMTITAILALLAVPSLRAMKKSGWDLLFYCSVITALLAVLRLFSGDGGGFFDFISTAAGTVIGAWLLFQARDYFMADVSAASAHLHTTADPVAHHAGHPQHDHPAHTHEHEHQPHTHESHNHDTHDTKPSADSTANPEDK